MNEQEERSLVENAYLSVANDQEAYKEILGLFELLEHEVNLSQEPCAPTEFQKLRVRLLRRVHMLTGATIVCRPTTDKVIWKLLDQWEDHLPKLHFEFYKFIRNVDSPLNPTTQTPTKQQETIMKLSDQTAVESKTYIFGKLAEEVSNDNIFTHIQGLENEKAGYEEIKNKPTALTAKIAAIQASIDSLVELSDSRKPK